MKDGVELIGEMGVDAGMCWIGDPCYILHRSVKEREELKKSIGKNWEQFISKTSNKQFNYPLGHPGLGVCFGEFGGDGTYAIYAEYRGGLIAKVWIDFAGEDEEDEE